eukprot:TRINITY_DN5414_c0_g3_i1.p1 TRINITY_DN5414_c0_g3~~TRINITY_DN5414_c0_g3_i1.p1  ORF type:complete len:447 (+),score=77.71 TRINITY_DN5414_c0_g3_i1:78-1343(+)
MATPAAPARPAAAVPGGTMARLRAAGAAAAGSIASGAAKARDGLLQAVGGGAPPAAARGGYSGAELGAGAAAAGRAPPSPGSAARQQRVQLRPGQMRCDAEIPAYLPPALSSEVAEFTAAAALLRPGDAVLLYDPAAAGVHADSEVARAVIVSAPRDGQVLVEAAGGSAEVSVEAVRHAPLHWRAAGWGPGGCDARSAPRWDAEDAGRVLDGDTIQTIRSEGGWMQLCSPRGRWVPTEGTGRWEPLYATGSLVRSARDVTFDNGRVVSTGELGVVTAPPAVPGAVCEVRIGGVRWDAKGHQVAPVHGVPPPRCGRAPARAPGQPGGPPRGPTPPAESCGTDTYGSVTANAQGEGASSDTGFDEVSDMFPAGPPAGGGAAEAAAPAATQAEPGAGDSSASPPPPGPEPEAPAQGGGGGADPA